MARSKSQQTAMTRFFDGLPVIDAERDIVLYPTARDVQKAVKADPQHCVLAQCAQRMFGSETVLFFRSYAYLDLQQRDGSRAVERFYLNEVGRQLIQHFDTRYPAQSPKCFSQV